MGFTLAEVLLTLAIIGIVAALTIPSLITKIQDQQYHTAWKKSYSQFSNAYADYLNDINGTGLDASPDLDGSINAIRPYFKTIKSCNWANQIECWHPAGEVKHLDGTPGLNPSIAGMVLADGTRVSLRNHGWGDCTGYGGACSHLVIDVNGAKGPNIVGKDIYGLYLMRDHVAPNGLSWDNNWYWACIEPPTAGWDVPANNNYGYGCSAKYLMQ